MEQRVNDQQASIYDYPPTSVALRMKRLRTERGWTREYASAKIGISTSSLAKYESGKIDPTVGKLMCIALTYDVSLDYICFGLERQPLRSRIALMAKNMNERRKCDNQTPKAEYRTYHTHEFSQE